MHPFLRAAAERQLGLFTAADARRAGYEQPEIQRLCASGTWRRVRRGVHITAEGLTTAEEKGRRHQVDCLAVLLELSRPTAVISHESAARLWGFPVRRSLLGPIRLIDPTLSRRGRDYRLTQAPLRTGEVARSGAIRLTAVSRTLLDCARQWAPEDAGVALDAALLATGDACAAHPGRRGAPRMARGTPSGARRVARRRSRRITSREPRPPPHAGRRAPRAGAADGDPLRGPTSRRHAPRADCESCSHRRGRPSGASPRGRAPGGSSAVGDHPSLAFVTRGVHGSGGG